jgi:hypothetical protein
MVRISSLVLAATIVSSAASAQVSSIQASNPMPKGNGQDLDRVVCDVEETTGTRLGARKVCKTVLEWQQLRAEHRLTVEKVQQMGNDPPISR